MSEESPAERIERLKSRENQRRELGEAETLGKWGRFKYKLKTGAKVAGVLGAVALAGLTYDYLTQRQNYPERNILFRSSSVTYVAGNPGKRAAGKSDILCENKFSEGGDMESKVGTKAAETERELRGDIDYYNLYDPQNRRAATATQKPEKFQVGPNMWGYRNFREQFAEVILPSGSKAPQKYLVYKFAPERGLEEMDSDIVEFPVERGLKENEPGIIEEDRNVPGKKDIRVMVNRLVEFREWGLGWLYGKKFRSGTLLEDYARTPENVGLAREFFSTIEALDSSRDTTESTRLKLVKRAMKLEEKMKKNTIYSTFEDGYFKILPQESTIFLGHNPNLFERFKHWLGFNSERIRLRVENHWDLIPGRWPLIYDKHFGSGENTIYPFDKFNNGGYSIKDKFGAIAKIDINDFIFKYGQDVLYSYFLDLNGDGKIDEKKELIGRVLCRTSHDEKMELEKIAKGIKPENDITFNINSAFLMPSSDLEQGKRDFKLCAYTESMIPDQVHRGFGEHSLLGYINDQRSDIILNQELSVENMSRALTQESTLVAKYDIIRVLNATRRPYARQLAKQWGIEQDFEGQYQSSDLLRKRIPILPWMELAAGAGLAGWGYNQYRKRKKMDEQNPEKSRVRSFLASRRK